MGGGGKNNPVSQVSNTINSNLSNVGNQINSNVSSGANTANEDMSNASNDTNSVLSGNGPTSGGQNTSSGGLEKTIEGGSNDQKFAAGQAAAALAAINQQVDQFGASRAALPGRAQTLLTQNYGQPGNTLLTIAKRSS